jgi:Silencing defective 2 N-terminal ubiquitin domain
VTEDSTRHSTSCLPAGIAQAEQRLIYGGRQLPNNASLQTCGVQPDATLHLVLRLCGGKGGFGALLRAGARATVSQNTDACRDLSGRRMRHVNADKKLEGAL